MYRRGYLVPVVGWCVSEALCACGSTFPLYDSTKKISSTSMMPDKALPLPLPLAWALTLMLIAIVGVGRVRSCRHDQELGVFFRNSLI